MVQDLTDLPSRWTTQAPHWLVSQPTCVPVRPRFSRRNCTSSVRPSTLPVTVLPFTVMDTAGIPLASLWLGGRSPERRAPVLVAKRLASGAHPFNRVPQSGHLPERAYFPG